MIERKQDIESAEEDDGLISVLSAGAGHIRVFSAGGLGNTNPVQMHGTTVGPEVTSITYIVITDDVPGPFVSTTLEDDISDRLVSKHERMVSRYEGKGRLWARRPRQIIQSAEDYHMSIWEQPISAAKRWAVAVLGGSANVR